MMLFLCLVYFIRGEGVKFPYLVGGQLSTCYTLIIYDLLTIVRRKYLRTGVDVGRNNGIC